MDRTVAGMFSVIDVAIMGDAILCGAVTISFVVGVGQAVDRSRSRNESNRDWRSDKAGQRERGKECPDTGSDAFGQPIQHSCDSPATLMLVMAMIRRTQARSNDGIVSVAPTRSAGVRQPASVVGPGGLEPPTRRL